MKNSNYYLHEIAENTANTELPKMKNEIAYLKKIAENLGATIPTGLKNRNVYLRLIEEFTRNYKSNIIPCGDTIVATGETVDCKVLVIKDGKVEKDLKVEYSIGDEEIGYGYTNEYGFATLDYNTDDESIDGYTGTGKGKVVIMAECGLLQETFVLLDAVFYDDGISDTITNYYLNSSNLHRTVYPTGTELENVHATSTYYFKAIKTDTPTPSSLNDCKVFTGDLCVEFTKVSQTGTGSSSPSIAVGDFGRYLSNYSDDAIVKLTVEDGKVYRYTSDGTKTDTGTTITGNYSIGFTVPPSAKVKYLDFKVYPI